MSSVIPNLCLAILGPTGAGKSEFALQLAQNIHGEIIATDSTTVYRGFDIGSAKPSSEDRAKVPHHLIDILEPDEPFSAHHFVELADETITEVQKRNRIPIVVGGTYFYFRALQHGMYPLPVIPAETIDGIEREFFEDEHLNTKRMHEELKRKDPSSAAWIHPNDRYRLIRALAIFRTTGELPSQLKPQPLSSEQASRLWLKYALVVSRHHLNQNIILRTEKMIHEGLIEETKQLMEKCPNARGLQSVGYAEACLYLNRKLTEKRLRNEIIEKTRQLAKRQVSWLRSDPEVRYIDRNDLARVRLEIENLQFALAG